MDKNKINDPMKPKISVIISSYNRKEFIRAAVESAMDQTLEKDLYEIIVVKNFIDDEIDSFLKQNNIKNLYYSPDIAKYAGAKAVKGIKSAEGDIICFLDDDDLFSKDKLEEVYKVFADGKVGFYHNGHKIYYLEKTIDDRWVDSGSYYLQGKKEFGNNDVKFLLQHQFWFNSSSISIRKDLIDLELLDKVKFTIDYYLAFMGINSDMDAIFDYKPLTLYRVHQSNGSKSSTDDFRKFCDSHNAYNTSRIEDHITIFNYYKNTKVANVLGKYFFKKKLGYLLFSENGNASKADYIKTSLGLINYDLKTGAFGDIKEACGGCLLFVLSPTKLKRMLYHHYIDEETNKKHILE